jgi:hypothetical protein
MKFVKVLPQVAYANGRQTTVTALHLKSVFDDLFGQVVFRYILLDANGVQCGEGAVELKGDRYKLWDSSPESAYTIVLAELGLEAVGGAVEFGG